jgi:hypothetical protein
MKHQLLKLLFWFKDLFTKAGRTANYFNSVAGYIKDAAISKLTARRNKKREVIAYVKWLQSGPKKSFFEIEQLLYRKGVQLDNEGNVISKSLAGQLQYLGIKTNFKKMQFIN